MYTHTTEFRACKLITELSYVWNAPIVPTGKDRCNPLAHLTALILPLQHDRQHRFTAVAWPNACPQLPVGHLEVDAVGLPAAAAAYSPRVGSRLSDGSPAQMLV